MDLLKRRFYILGLSLLVLIIALAGLLGILDSLSESTTTTANPGNGEPTTTQPPDNGEKPPGTETPNQNSNDKAPPSQAITPKFVLSLPDSFNLGKVSSTNPGLALGSAMPVHFPILEVTGAANTEYLKSITAAYYDGAEWLPTELGDYIEYNGKLIVPPGIDPDQIVTDDITVSTLVDIVNGKAAIPTSLYPVSVNSSEPLLYFPDDMTFLAEEEFPEEYIFETAHYIFDRQTLANANLDLIQEYLQLPENITPRTYELAETITGGIESSYYMAKAIEDYLKTEYTYSYEFESAPAGWEPNDWFLFEEKSGVCTNFNSAFVILCRAAGLPARLAGGFHIAPQAATQTVYADQAHAWAEVKFDDLGWYTFDATGSLPAVTPTVTEITVTSPTAQKGEEFMAAGTVWTDTEKPTEGVLVEILVNDTKAHEGAVLVGQGIVTGGHFEIHAVIPGEVAVGEYHVLAHTLKTARYQESWSDPIIKVVSGVSINLQMPDRIKTGEKLALKGSLTGEFGEALGGQKLQLYLNGDPAASPTTDSAGNFSWENSFDEPGDYILQVSYPGTEYFLAATGEAKFRVLAPAVLTFKTDGNLINSPVKVDGRLTEAKTNDPLTDRALLFYIDGILQENRPVTDNGGRFDFKYTFSDAGEHNIEVKFPGDADYYEATATADINIVISATFSPWPIIIAALALIAVGAGGWFLYRRLKKNRVPEVPEAAPETPMAATTPWKTSDSSRLLTIEFPQIGEPLPDVWGVGEELTIALRLTDEVGTGLVAPLEVLISNEGIIQTTTDKDGRAEIRHTFKHKGQYNITVKYEESTGGNKASAVGAIRIVDYREEIVSLFNTLVAEFRGMGISIAEEFTPRKIQYLVLNADKGIPEKALEDAVYCFEETDYSLHPITRKHYEIMYLAQREIKQHGTKPAAAA